MLAQLQKPAVQMILLVVVVAIAGIAFYVSKQPAQAVNTPRATADGKPPANLMVEEKKVGLGENRTATIGAQQQVDKFTVPTTKPPPPSLLNSSSGQKKQQPQQPPPFPKLVHLTDVVQEPFTPQEPRLFAPRGVLIKAALVITVDSSSLETPVLGLVTEDLYWNQQLILPAGTQVHAKAGKGRTRDRIEINGNYTFIWEDGREYSITGIALDHQRLSDNTYSITDGSAGIRGQIVKNDEYAEVKILIAEALQGVMNNQQQQFQSIYGLVPQNNSRNAALGGGSQAASAYSQLLTKKLDQDLDFVRVPAGTQFYIYTMSVFEPELASIAGLRQKGQALSSWQLAEETYARATTETAAAGQKAAISAAAAEKARKDQQTTAQLQQVNSIIANPPSSSAGSSTGVTPVPASLTTPSSNP